jgi:hypothetical protein
MEKMNFQLHLLGNKMYTIKNIKRNLNNFEIDVVTKILELETKLTKQNINRVVSNLEVVSEESNEEAGGYINFVENYIDLKDDFLGIKVEAKVNDNYTADFLLIIRNRMIDCLEFHYWDDNGEILKPEIIDKYEIISG